MTERKSGAWEICAAAALAVLCLAFYLPFHNGRFAHADENMIFGAPAADRQSTDAYGAGSGNGDAYEWTPQRPPLVKFWYTTGERLWGRAPSGYHISQAALFCICVLLVFLLGARLARGEEAWGLRRGVEAPPYRANERLAGGGGGIAAGHGGPALQENVRLAGAWALPFAGALLFCVHPGVVGGAVWISGVKDSIAALFLLLSTILYISDSSNPKQSVSPVYAGAVVCFLLACNTDCRAVFWPVVFAAQSRFAVPAGTDLKGRGGRLLKLVPFFATGIFYGVLFLRIGGYAWPGGGGFDVSYFLGAAGAYAKEIMLLGGIGGPVSAGAFPPHVGTAVMAVGALYLLLPLLFAAWALVARKQYFACMCAVWFLAAFAPRLVEWREFMMDHGACMSVAPVCLLFAGIFIPDARASRAKIAAAVLALLVAAGFLGAQAHARAGYYSSDISFWARASEDFPAQAGAWYSLGSAYTREGRAADAEKPLEQAVKLAPGKRTYIVSLGLNYLARKKYDEARAQFSGAMKLDPNDEYAYAGISAAHLEQGRDLMRAKRYDEARAHFREAVILSPEDAHYHGSLSAAYLGEGNYQGAYAEAAIASRLAPADASLKRDMAAVLAAAARAGVTVYTAGVTDDFFNKLEAAEKGAGARR